MKLPVELNKTLHKHGGVITRITGITHECARPDNGRSQDVWYFIGDVAWRDGSNSVGLLIAPWAICALDGAKEPEVRDLMDLMETYLLENGTWCEQESRHEGWYANVRPETKVRRRA